MIRQLPFFRPSGIAAGLIVAALAVPAQAQERTTDTGEKYNMVLVYGDQPCQESKDADVITVCARMGDEFRIPEPLRGSDSPQNEPWASKVRAYETVGAFGTNSCSPNGPGGSTGCTQQLVKAAYQEKRTGSAVKFGELISKAREERLSTIDQTAAADQARVEEAEKAYFEQQKQRAATAEEAAAGEPLPQPKP